MVAPKTPRAKQISFDDVTEVALGGVLRALEAHRRELAVDQLVFKNPPIIYGIWIMPEDLEYNKLREVATRASGKG